MTHTIRAHDVLEGLVSRRRGGARGSLLNLAYTSIINCFVRQGLILLHCHSLIPTNPMLITLLRGLAER